jgi:hypothetical protein
LRRALNAVYPELTWKAQRKPHRYWQNPDKVLEYVKLLEAKLSIFCGGSKHTDIVLEMNVNTVGADH